MFLVIGFQIYDHAKVLAERSEQPARLRYSGRHVREHYGDQCGEFNPCDYHMLLNVFCFHSLNFDISHNKVILFLFPYFDNNNNKTNTEVL